MSSIDADWLRHTYPPAVPDHGSEVERVLAQERACLERLEALCWPEDAVCPKCKEPSDRRWNSAPRGLGWRCQNPECRARFHVLQAVPGMDVKRGRAATWFKAAYLLANNREMTVSALSRALCVPRSTARTLTDSIDELRRADPLILDRLIAGPAGDAAVMRKRTKRRG